MSLNNVKENVCNFIKSSEVDSEITPLNFVYEKNWHKPDTFSKSSYTLAIVTGGTGAVIYHSSTYPLRTGDIFFLFCDQEYRINNIDGLEFVYVSFTGSRVLPLFDRLHIKASQITYHGYEDLIPFWLSSIERISSFNNDLISQSVLYYTLSFLADSDFSKSKSDSNPNQILLIKRFIDDNFNMPELSLDYLSHKFGYNSKYISERFRAITSINLSSYITQRRIEYAKSLLKMNSYTISQISDACGFADPLYFSKVFKKVCGISPMTYAKSEES